MKGNPRHLDYALARRVLRGQHGAFEEFFNAYANRLYRFALSRLDDDPQTAEDIVQTTLCQAISKMNSYKGEAALFTWLCSICRNQIADHFRRGQQAMARQVPMDEEGIQRILQSLEANPHDNPEHQYARRQLIGLIQSILDHLPVRQGNALEDKYIHGRSVAEIAGSMDISASAAQSLLARGREAFREALEQLFVSSDEDDGRQLLDELLNRDHDTTRGPA